MRKLLLKTFSLLLCFQISFTSQASSVYFMCSGSSGSTPGHAAQNLCFESELNQYCGGYSFPQNFGIVQLYHKSGGEWVQKNCSQHDCIDGQECIESSLLDSGYCTDGLPADALNSGGFYIDTCDRPEIKVCSDGSYVQSEIGVCPEPLGVCTDEDSCLSYAQEQLPCDVGVFDFYYETPETFGFQCTLENSEQLIDYSCNSIECGTSIYNPPTSPDESDEPDTSDDISDDQNPDASQDTGNNDEGTPNGNPSNDSSSNDGSDTSGSNDSSTNTNNGIGELVSLSVQQLDELKDIKSEMEEINNVTGEINSDLDTSELEGFYTSSYPNGFLDVWSNIESNLYSSAAISYVESWRVTVSGEAPNSNFCIDMFGINQCISFDFPAWIWAFIRAVILFSTVLFCRSLIFGG